MHVKRLDLGADVVHVPTRDILVIHPDLNYAEALGAVAATLPHLHLDAVKSLVEQVTPRREPSLWPRVLVQAAASLVVSALVILTGWGATSPASADGPRFGAIWQEQIESMGMECDPVRDRITTCVAGKDVVLVEGFRHRHADLYLVDRPGPDDTQVLVFDHDRWARQFVDYHPEAERAGRVVIL